jgi:hypothetical protein
MTDTTPADVRAALLAWLESLPSDEKPAYRNAFYAGAAWQASAALVLDNELAEIEGRHLEKARAASEGTQWTQEQVDEIHRRGEAMFEKLKPSPPDIAKVVADNLSSLYDGESQPAQEPVARLDIPKQARGSMDIFVLDDVAARKLGAGQHMLYAAPLSDQARQDRIEAEKYRELLYAVTKKFPGESRHDTALRYIMRAEDQCSGPCAALEAEVRKP